ncbi:MAG: hypothetical protein KAT65_03295 [Methanophagales archaeon]|nr:hypothetical protein [Methanophagales archaeon]
MEEKEGDENSFHGYSQNRKLYIEPKKFITAPTKSYPIAPQNKGAVMRQKQRCREGPQRSNKKSRR